MSEIIKINGREFTTVKSLTLEHDIYLMTHIRSAGLDILSQEPAESVDLYVERLLTQVLQSNKVFKLLAGLLLPIEIAIDKWSLEIAEEIESFLKKLTDQRDKDIIKNLIVGLLIDFFQSGLISSMTSQKSLITKFLHDQSE